MKAVCIVGSARSNGSTAYLIDALIKGMREAGIESKKYAIGEKKIGYAVDAKNVILMGYAFSKMMFMKWFQIF